MVWTLTIRHSIRLQFRRFAGGSPDPVRLTVGLGVERLGGRQSTGTIMPDTIRANVGVSVCPPRVGISAAAAGFPTADSPPALPQGSGRSGPFFFSGALG